MKISVLKETSFSEGRVAASPETVKKFKSMGFSVAIEKSAGVNASIPDKMYEEAGAEIGSRSQVLKDASIVLKIRSPLIEKEKLEDFPENAVLLCLCDILQNPSHAKEYAKHSLSVVALELIPRITRAQAMDVLSSQSNLAGYRAVLEACNLFQRIFPMMMTAAGTLLPAKVLVLGAGVAGLQATATAKRLGAVVSVYDVRPATKEQVESLGAQFIEVEKDDTSKEDRVYAQEMTADYKHREKEKLFQVVKASDIVITTALIPGRPAPELVTKDMVKAMKPGSVIIDLAGENGGNCSLSKLGEIVIEHDVQVYAPQNILSKLARDASDLYARNVLNFVKTFYNDQDGQMHLSLEDDIIKQCLLTLGTKVLRTDLH